MALAKYFLLIVDQRLWLVRQATQAQKLLDIFNINITIYGKRRAKPNNFFCTYLL